MLKKANIEPSTEQKESSPNKNVQPKGSEEITAQISVPHEKGHGWLVLIAAFCNIFILDGVVFSFGSILLDVSHDLNISDSLAALLNSTSIAMYFLASPFASACINRYGFRSCIMTGSVMSCFSLAVAYFVTSYGLLILFYGVIAGFGYSLINMASMLIVGFYFERLRSIAMSLATSGSSIGVMVLYPVNTYMVNLVGWRITSLFHCGLMGSIYFLGMAYRPLLSLSVTKTEEDASSVTRPGNLPKILSADSVQPTKPSSLTPSVNIPTRSDGLFNASNAKYPTASEVISSMTMTNTSVAGQPGPSSSSRISSKLTLKTTAPPAGLGRRQLKHIQAIISKTSQQKKGPYIQLHIHDEEPMHSRCCWTCCGRLCHWESHPSHSRPMYRDDAFYHGSIRDLHEYRKCIDDTKDDERTGLEYRMAVSRTVAVHDLNEHHGLFSTAVKRVLATMMDPTLLKRSSFILMCLSGFVTYMGYLVPYVYLQDRNLKAGMDPHHCTLLVSAIGFSNAVGRVTVGCIASKIEPIKVFATLYTLAGLSTVCSTFSFNLYFQYAYSCTYGFCLGSSSLRSVILVSLYGLDKLTNAMGMMLIFLGLGNLASTPVASVLKNHFGYQFAFVAAGIFVAISGIMLFPIKALALRNK